MRDHFFHELFPLIVVNLPYSLVSSRMIHGRKISDFVLCVSYWVRCQKPRESMPLIRILSGARNIMIWLVSLTCITLVLLLIQRGLMISAVWSQRILSIKCCDGMGDVCRRDWNLIKYFIPTTSSLRGVMSEVISLLLIIMQSLLLLGLMSNLYSPFE